jgi:hypothetical protein
MSRRLALRQKKEEGGVHDCHWAMRPGNLVSGLDSPQEGYARAVGRARHWTFGHAAAMQFLGGQGLHFRWLACEGRRVRSRARDQGPIVLFQHVSHLNKTQHTMKDSAVRKKDDPPGPGPLPARPRSFPHSIRRPSTRQKLGDRAIGVAR